MMNSGRAAVAIALTAAILAMRLGLVAGAGSSRQVPTFRSVIDLVKVDVSVLDKDGRPLHGLSARDFTILEDGKPQQIQAFSGVDLAGPDGKAAGWMHDRRARRAHERRP